MLPHTTAGGRGVVLGEVHSPDSDQRCSGLKDGAFGSAETRGSASSQDGRRLWTMSEKGPADTAEVAVSQAIATPPGSPGECGTLGIRGNGRQRTRRGWAEPDPPSDESAPLLLLPAQPLPTPPPHGPSTETLS